MIKKLKIIFILLLMGSGRWVYSRNPLSKIVQDIKSFDLNHWLNPHVNAGLCQQGQVQVPPGCPSYLKGKIEQWDEKWPFIYRPWDVCMKHGVVNISRVTYETAMERDYIPFATTPPDIGPGCYDDFSGDPKLLQMMTSAFHYNVHRRLSVRTTNLYNELMGIDYLIDPTKKPLRNLHCRFDINQNVEKTCRRLKECQALPDHREKTLNLTNTILHEIYKLKDIKKEIDKEIRSAGVKGGDRSVKLKKYSATEKNELIARSDLIGEQISQLESTFPWLGSRTFQNKKFKKELKDRLKDNWTTAPLVEKALDEYLENTKAQLLKEYDRNYSMNSCMAHDNYHCDRFSRYEADLPDAPLKRKMSFEEESPYADKHYRIRHVEDSLQCLKWQIEDNKSIKKLARDTSIGVAGAFVGGLGGLLKVASMATNLARVSSLTARSAAVGVIAVSLLGSEAAYTKQIVQEVQKSCKNFQNQVSLINNQNHSVRSCDALQIQSSLHSNIASCVKNFALLSLPFAANMAPGMVRNIVSNKSTHEATEEASKRSIHHRVYTSLNHLTTKQKDQLAKAIHELDLPEDKLMHLLGMVSDLPKNGRQIKRLQDYLLYLQTLSPKKRIKAIDHIDDLFKTIRISDLEGHAKKFAVEQRGFWLYEKMKRQSLAKKYQRQGMSKMEANRQAIWEARDARALLQHTVHSCRAQKINTHHLKAAKDFAKFSLAIGLGSTAYGYTKATWDQEKDATWGAKLGYELSMAYILTKIAIAIMKNPSGTIMERYKIGAQGAIGISAIDAVVYSHFYGLTEEEARERIDRIKNDPTEKEVLDKFLATIDIDKYIENYKRGIIEDYKKAVKTDYRGLLGDPPHEIGGESFDVFTLEKLNNKEFQNKLVRAAMQEMYQNGAGVVQLGNSSLDRLSYNVVWNSAIGVTKGIFMGFGIYYSLCMGSINPAAGLLGAIAIKGIDNFISADYYYRYRQKLINQ